MKSPRKRLFSWILWTVIAVPVWVARAQVVPVSSPASPWDRLPEILQRIAPPVFPDRDFRITDYGALGDGTTDCTEAFRKAIETCHNTGGGRVVVPPGNYLSGAIHLKSKVNLHVTEGATIKFSQDPAKYLPVVQTRFEGVELMNYSPFIYSFGQRDIAVTGKGELDGQADQNHWWQWARGTDASGQRWQTADRKALFQQAEEGVPVEKRIFGAGHYLRPNFLQTYRCENVLIEGVTIRNSPMWEIHPVLSRNVTVRNVTVSSHGPNNDGCDPESSTDVRIQNSVFDTGDDCIAIKSGRNADGRRVNASSKNIVVQGCRMKDGHGGVVLGSEVSGGVSNVYAEDCTMDSPNLDRALRIKTNSIRGGILENIYMRNITIGQVREAIILVDFFYEEGDSGSFTPVVRNIDVRNLKSLKSRYALSLNGYERSPIQSIFLDNCTFEGVEKDNILKFVQGLVMQNVRINGRLQN